MYQAGGVSFARLYDESAWIGSEMSEIGKAQLRELQEKYDMYLNIDFTPLRSAILWKDFLTIPKYVAAGVGAYEGAAGYSYGVWRPEHSSCMRDWREYFNAPSRWAIVKRIKKLAGIP